jgi:hypothetical protein
MNYRVAEVKKLVGFLVVGIFSLCLANTTLAQGPPPGAGAPANNNPKSVDRSRQVDQSKLRTAEMNAVIDDQNQKRLQAAIVNMKEDFTQIQVVRNNIARGLVARKPLDYKLVSDQTAEINKRASRLNVYMRAHAPDDEKENDSPELKSEEMVDALVKLCKLIDSFTENPALKNVATIDSKEVAKAKENKAKADGDLLSIIKLSDRIHKRSDTLEAPR